MSNTLNVETSPEAAFLGAPPESPMWKVVYHLKQADASLSEEDARIHLEIADRWLALVRMIPVGERRRRTHDQA